MHRRHGVGVGGAFVGKGTVGGGLTCGCTAGQAGLHPRAPGHPDAPLHPPRGSGALWGAPRAGHAGAI